MMARIKLLGFGDELHKVIHYYKETGEFLVEGTTGRFQRNEIEILGKDIIMEEQELIELLEKFVFARRQRKEFSQREKVLNYKIKEIMRDTPFIKNQIGDFYVRVDPHKLVVKEID